MIITFIKGVIIAVLELMGSHFQWKQIIHSSDLTALLLLNNPIRGPYFDQSPFRPKGVSPVLKG